MTPEEQTWRATLRPSRIREVQAGALGWTALDLIDVEAGAGSTVRPVLEGLGVPVSLFRVGQGRHLVTALSRGAPAPFVLLACHGDEGHILVPELAPELERFQPFQRRCGPRELRSFARLAGSVVISTGCETGTPALAEAFLGAGASAYIAPEGAPFGYASLFAPIFLFYELVEGRSLDEAVHRLQAHDAELAMWRLFRSPGEQPLHRG